MDNPHLVAAYTGPWYVPHKRAKKDPAAPKRNPSAFLLFAQGKRQELKKHNPGKTNTDISRILGKLWRNASVEEKRHHIEREVKEREQYKISMADWRKQQETRQSAREAESTTFSPVTTTIESGIGRKVQPVIVEDSVAARVHSEDDDACDLNQRVLDDPITSKDNNGASLHPPRIIRNGLHMYHQQRYMYLEYPSQEYYMHDCIHDVYPSELRCHSLKQYMFSRPQHRGSSSVNGRYFNPIPFRDTNHEPLQPKSHARQQRSLRPESHARQQRSYTNNLCMPSNNDSRYLLQNTTEQEGHAIHYQYHYQKQQHQLAFEQNIAKRVSFENSDEINQLLQKSKEQEGRAIHHQYHHQNQHQQQHHPLALEQNIVKHVSFEKSDEINQQYVRDETKEVDIDMDNLYYQEQNYSARDDMKQEYDNLNRQHYNQQPSPHAVDQDTPNNLPTEKLDNTQQLWASLRCGEGFISPLNMYDNIEYDHAHMI